MSILDRFRLDNRVAIVTGGSKGLGKEMATALAEAGAQVAVVSRNAEQTQAVAQEIQTAIKYIFILPTPFTSMGSRGIKVNLSLVSS